jgi:hypothetical protein
MKFAAVAASLILLCVGVGMMLAGSSGAASLPRGAPTATPTCTLPIFRTNTPTAPTQTPTAEPYATCEVFVDPYQGYGSFNAENWPSWKFDVNNNGGITGADANLVQQCFFELNWAGCNVYVGAPTATQTVAPTATLETGCYAVSDGEVVGTCTPCGEGCGGGTPEATPTPEDTVTPTITATPTEVKVTEAQAAELIQGVDQLVVYVGLVAAFAGASLLASVFLFFRRR